MKIPEGLDEEYVVTTISSIAKKIAHKYVFASYQADDIEQEAFLIGMECLDRYDQVRPLENFLYTHMNNRLKNFKRDNYYRLDHGNAQKVQDRKRSILEPLSFEYLYTLHDKEEVVNQAHVKEMLDLIDKKLPSNMRKDYLKLKSNSFLLKRRRADIMREIRCILDPEQGEEGSDHEEG
tara:strand:+ start:539 stop:1075 length:537 start_codon:yes stop_codon:yes gene_type:complete